jgi:hypothetical protein
VYGYGAVPSSFADERGCVALKKALNRFSPAIDFFEESVPTHLPWDFFAIDPP